ncbi:hypothetical protein IG631_00493 [Alternaria alternata]|nr:hypothetical protein IG631_00493 [Alternaria alternata]
MGVTNPVERRKLQNRLNQRARSEWPCRTVHQKQRIHPNTSQETAPTRRMPSSNSHTVSSYQTRPTRAMHRVAKAARPMHLKMAPANRMAQ